MAHQLWAYSVLWYQEIKANQSHFKYDNYHMWSWPEKNTPMENDQIIVNHLSMVADNKFVKLRTNSAHYALQETFQINIRQKGREYLK